MLTRDASRKRKSPLPGYMRQETQIGRRTAEAARRMVAGRSVAQVTEAEEGHRSKEEKSVARVQEAGDSGQQFICVICCSWYGLVTPPAPALGKSGMLLGSRQLEQEERLAGVVGVSVTLVFIK
ncbi:hypothetical protein NDU88_007332 [Pleurodeles waltl]|uniref:Uncharacterized protein n=1 Tax=Pleurodeles waltl TaxID=8319 RepID=A0AAV7N519_PLEWA|nr:hypothetical protein NDU88_007332 [Pleurodeles waltl]